MIIRYPTGSYDIFGSLSKASNISWYISSNDPPRSSDVVLKVPIAEESRTLPPPAIKSIKRGTYGELVYTISTANNTIAASLTKVYGEGDILGFSIPETANVDIPRSENIQLRHDLNEINLSDVGLDSEDVVKFNNSVSVVQTTLEASFLVVRSSISDLEITIQEIQKKINETNKALSAVTIIGDVELQIKIKSKLDSYQSQLNLMVEDHNQKTTELSGIVDDMIQIGMVAK